MAIIIFVIVLAILILSHELGHFLAAKKFGVKVEEFGLGFPPRIYSKKRGETVYSLNALPIGGFVKILGEDPDEGDAVDPNDKKNLINKPRWMQAIILVAGVSCNLLLAWALLSVGYLSGLPISIGSLGVAGEQVTESALMVTGVLPDSPADRAGLEIGDSIIFLETKNNRLIKPSIEEVQLFLASNDKTEVKVGYRQRRDAFLPENAGVILIANLTPEDGWVSGRAGIGISMDHVGLVKLPVHLAVIEGGKLTLDITKQTIGAFVRLLASITNGGGSLLASVVGPVGLVGLVGDASRLGIVYLLSFTAIISINLAVINMIPFPALDGGRLLFLLIEAVKGSRLDPKIANTLNAIGLILLLGLMLAVTYSDVIKMF